MNEKHYAICENKCLVETYSSVEIDEKIENVKVKDGSVTTSKLSDNSVTTSKLSDSSITTNKLADNSVTNEKIAENSIGSSKISSNSIMTKHIQNNAITNSKIADDSVSWRNIQSDAIGNTHILDGSVTNNKLDSNSVSVSGFYNGDGSESEITVGFKPKIVFISKNGTFSQGYVTEYQATRIYYDTSSAKLLYDKQNRTDCITNTGFITPEMLCETGEKYYYVAIF